MKKVNLKIKKDLDAGEKNDAREDDKLMFFQGGRNINF